MESPSTNTVLGSLALVISVVTTIIGLINHRRIRSKCCDRKIEMELDIESTRPSLVVPQPSPLTQKKPELIVRQNSETK